MAVKEEILQAHKRIKYVFKPAVYQSVQRAAQSDPKLIIFKNKPQNAAYDIKVRIGDVEKIDKQIKLSSEIHVPSSFSLTPEEGDHDRYLITALVERIIKHNVMTELDEKQNYSLIAGVLLELIENAEKAVLLNLAQDLGIPGLSREQYINPQIRSKLVKYARSKHKEVAAIFRFKKDYLGIFVSNNTFINYRTMKDLEQKASRGISEGSHIGHHIRQDTGQIGAGIGLTMSKAILDGITKEKDIAYDFGPARDDSGNTVMAIEFYKGNKEKLVGTA